MQEHKLSIFAHIIERNPLTVWHSLNFKKVIVDSKTAPYLGKVFSSQTKTINTSKIDEKVLSYLKEEGVIIEEEEDEELINEVRKQVGVPQVQSLFLIITRKCNLDCIYCFYNKENSQSLAKRSESMSKEIAFQAIDTFSELTRENVITSEYWQAITFYGGEPLLLTLNN